MFFVCFLECSDGKIYTGCTSNLQERMKRHQKGQVSFTKPRLPVKLVLYAASQDKYKAYGFESYLKTGSGRAFMRKHLL